jgi:hypothetical protein
VWPNIHQTSEGLEWFTSESIPPTLPSHPRKIGFQSYAATGFRIAGMCIRRFQGRSEMAKPKYIQAINQLPKVVRDNIEVYRKERGEHIFRPLFDEKQHPCICLVCEKPIERESRFEMFTYRKKDDPNKMPQFFADIHYSCFKELRKSSRGISR